MRHPDDENTRLISYLSNEARTGYLSLTRGDGGQNLRSSITRITGCDQNAELLSQKIDGGAVFLVLMILVF
jgi:hypothetical protein